MVVNTRKTRGSNKPANFMAAGAVFNHRPKGQILAKTDRRKSPYLVTIKEWVKTEPTIVIRSSKYHMNVWRVKTTSNQPNLVFLHHKCRAQRLIRREHAERDEGQEADEPIGAHEWKLGAHREHECANETNTLLEANKSIGQTTA